MTRPTAWRPVTDDDRLRTYVEHFRHRVLQDAMTEATGAYWRRRAQDFEDLARSWLRPAAMPLKWAGTADEWVRFRRQSAADAFLRAAECHARAADADRADFDFERALEDLASGDAA